MSEHGCWVYAVTDQYEGEDLTGLSGVGGAPVRAIDSAGLAVLASDVDLAEFGADALRRNLEDLDWLEGTARAHHQVIDALSRLFPLLPMRLATVGASETATVGTFTDQRAELRDALAQVRGRAEWGVKAYARPSERPARAAAGDAAAVGGSGSTGQGAGMAYLKRRRQELTSHRNSQRDTAASARAVHDTLAGHAAAFRLHPPQSSQLSGERAPMLLNASYLLDVGGETGFTSSVTEAAGAYPDLRLELTGPWPPYSFAGGDAG
ncbi:MAG TPA: GvpL/GvpF family gas vesicle protein [Trebonia sp.]|jgi:hypothetical protein